MRKQKPGIDELPYNLEAKKYGDKMAGKFKSNQVFVMCGVKRKEKRQFCSKKPIKMASDAEKIYRYWFWDSLSESRMVQIWFCPKQP